MSFVEVCGGRGGGGSVWWWWCWWWKCAVEVVVVVVVLASEEGLPRGACFFAVEPPQYMFSSRVSWRRRLMFTNSTTSVMKDKQSSFHPLSEQLNPQLWGRVFCTCVYQEILNDLISKLQHKYNPLLMFCASSVEVLVIIHTK